MTFLWLPDKYLTIVCEVCPMTSRIVLPIAYKQKLYNVLIRQSKNWKLHLKYKCSSRYCFNPLWVPTMGAVDLSARKKKHFSSHHCAMYARIRSWPFFMDAIVLVVATCDQSPTNKVMRWVLVRSSSCNETESEIWTSFWLVKQFRVHDFLVHF